MSDVLCSRVIVHEFEMAFGDQKELKSTNIRHNLSWLASVQVWRHGQVVRENRPDVVPNATSLLKT
jgi:hypothetical protein